MVSRVNGRMSTKTFFGNSLRYFLFKNNVPLELKRLVSSDRTTRRNE